MVMIVNIKPLFMICILFFTPLSYSIVDKEIVKHPYCHNLYVGTVAHIGFSETLSLGEPDIECDSAITQKGLTKKETKSEIERIKIKPDDIDGENSAHSRSSSSITSTISSDILPKL